MMSKDNRSFRRDEISPVIMRDGWRGAFRINTEKTSLVAQFDPLSPIAESFRRLRTNIRYSAVDEPIRRLLVTSPTPKEGKTTVATNLAVILAQDGLRTILIDGDLRRPTIQKLFRSKIDSGLSTLFVHPELSVDLVLKPTNIVGFQVLPCGERPPNPAELPRIPTTDSIKEGNGRDQGITTLSGKTPDAEPLNGKKINLKQTAKEILEFLNDKTGKNFQPVSANLDLICARLKEGYTTGQLRQIIARQYREWHADEKMQKYLRPATLFNKTKCANYVGELVAQGDENALS